MLVHMELSCAALLEQGLCFGQPVSLGIPPGCSRTHQGGPCLLKGLFLSWGNAWWWWWSPFCLVRVQSMEEREDQKDRLDFVRNQLNILTEDTKEKIKRVTEEVENKVSKGNGNNFSDPGVASSLRRLLLKPTRLRKYVWNVRMFLFQNKKQRKNKSLKWQSFLTVRWLNDFVGQFAQ